MQIIFIPSGTEIPERLHANKVCMQSFRVPCPLCVIWGVLVFTSTRQYRRSRETFRDLYPFGTDW